MHVNVGEATVGIPTHPTVPPLTERDILRGAVADARAPRRVPGRMILGALPRLVSLEDGMSRHYHSTVERKELKFQ